MNSSHNQQTTANAGGASSIPTPANSGGSGLFGGHGVGATHGDAVNPPSTKPGMFDASGAVGKAFTADGAIGGTAQAIGGPLSADGAIGKAFTTAGGIGGSVQNTLGGGGAKKE